MATGASVSYLRLKGNFTLLISLPMTFSFLMAFIADRDGLSKYLYVVAQEVAGACATRSTIWRLLGFQLCLSTCDLNILKVNHQGDIVNLCSKMLELWQQRQTDTRADVNLETLRKALVNVELENVASIISNWLLPAETSSCTATNISKSKVGVCL